MAGGAVLFVGGPDSGKTNYLARLWEALREGSGRLYAEKAPNNIAYVEDALEHLLKGRFAPRTEATEEDSGRGLSIDVKRQGSDRGGEAQIVVPDASGELWSEAIQDYQLPRYWMDSLRSATGALLFVRVNSEQNVEPLDWVNARRLLRWNVEKGEDEPQDEFRVPTGVQLCELLRLMEFGLGIETDVRRPRVGVMITAWDILDHATACEGPGAYLNREYPLLAGRVADSSRLEVGVFGVSVVGGDLNDPSFRSRFLSENLNESGYVIVNHDGADEEADLTVPIAWVLDCDGDG